MVEELDELLVKQRRRLVEKKRPVSRFLGKEAESNYAFKPSAEQALRMSRSISCRAGLTRR
jgi:hypothetical protein